MHEDTVGRRCAPLLGRIYLLFSLAKSPTMGGSSSALAGTSFFLKVPPRSVQLIWGNTPDPVLARLVVPAKYTRPSEMSAPYRKIPYLIQIADFLTIHISEARPSIKIP